MPNRFAVIGNPVGHSLSPELHKQFAAQTGIALTYEKILAFDADFEKTVRNFFYHGGQGLNVTLPYKQRAFALCQVVSARAQAAQAVNTLWMKGSVLCGDNTDGAGLLRDLHHFLDLKNKSVLIIGAGGATRGLLDPVLKEQPASVTLTNRTMTKAYELQKTFPLIGVRAFHELDAGYDLIINATSSALTGERLPIADQVFAAQPMCYDLSYLKGRPTAFMERAQTLRCRVSDGLGMLIEQGAESFFLWLGVKPETAAVKRFMKKMR